MRQLLLIACSCAVLGGLAAQPLDARDGRTASEATKVRVLLAQEITLFNDTRWRSMWPLYAPRIRSRCSYTRFVAQMKPLRRATGRVALRAVSIRVTGTHAAVSYRIVAKGKVVGGTTVRNPDLFARVGGRWFDDFDPDGLCPSGGVR